MKKEDYAIEVKNYLYRYSSDSKELIDNIIKENNDLFYKYYYECIDENDEEYGNFYSAIYFTRLQFLNMLSFNDNFINYLVEKVKTRTWLFTDEQIKNKIIELHFSLYDFIIMFLYEDKGPLTKEEYTSEIMNYLYKISLDSKEEINKIMKKESEWFYKYFYDAQKDNNYYKAVLYAQNNMKHLIHY